MSYRKHRTVDELRTERAKHEQANAVAEASIKQREQMIADLQEEIAFKKKGVWMRGQMIASCNLWIARKETGQCT